ncbi:uncharacterized protein BJX67DRAFT_383150 [Aspergillus lucknowensis]|uniref:Mid2 domain-containing protein n=1 Tax=Aspergillus lucknowensis TaxID=176173 RepID=A0ABR4LLB2_9EURO
MLLSISASPIWILLLFLTSFPRCVIAIANPSTKSGARLDRDENYFTSPPSSDSGSSSDPSSNPVYEVGDILEISWVTTLDIFNVTIWQHRGSEEGSVSGGTIFSKAHSSDSISNITWAVQTYALDLSTSPAFFLSIDADTVSTNPDFENWNNNGFTSILFNISSSSSSTQSQSPTETESQPNPEITGTTLTSTGKIALGLGVGIGAPLISLLAILAYLQYRSARRGYAGSSQHHHQNTHLHPHSHGQSHHPSAMTMPIATQYPSLSPSPAIEGVQVPLYRSRAPSELPQKLGPPVILPPWEVHATPASGPTPDPPAGPISAPAPAPVSTVSRSTTVLDTGSRRGRDRREGARSVTVRSSRGLGIPELPGENYI